MLKKLTILLLFVPFLEGQICYGQTPGNVTSGTLEMWLKADDTTTVLNLSSDIASDGEEISQWSDLSGNRSNNATNTDELSNPTYSNNTSNNINYNPCLTFDGLGDGLNFGNDDIFPDGGLVGLESFDALTFFTVQKPSSSNSSKNLQYIYDVGAYDANGFGFAYGQENSYLYSPPGLVGAVITGALPSLINLATWLLGVSTQPNSNVSGLIAHSYEDKTTLARSNVVTGYDGVLNVLLGSASKSIYLNGMVVNTQNNFNLIKLNLDEIDFTTQHEYLTGPFTIGRQSKDENFSLNGTRAFEGQIAEIIGVSDNLSDAEVNRIESYLAVKYGITLEHGGTQSGNYTASDGTTVWSATLATSAFHNDVIGIGRDDDTGLLQKQSHTQDDSLRIYLSTLDSTNAANQGSFSSDLSYVIIGGNADNLYSSSSYAEKPSGLYSRLDREWRIQRTNFSDTFNLDIVLHNNAIVSDIDVSDLYLLVDNDGDFSDATLYNTTNDLTFGIVGNVLTVSGIHTGIIPNNSTNFFTIGSGSGNTPLPVQLTSFTALPTEQREVEINWITATERNNDYYSIYHSTDGEHWLLIEKIKGAGNAEVEQKYNYVHSAAQLGANYYKLEQTDLNGETTDLGMRGVEIKTEKVALMLYPNPVKDGLHLVGPIDFDADIYIINALGMAIKVNDYTVLSEEHIVINTAFLSKGMYALKINNQSLRFNKL